jgi:sporulation protein YlmC with PRC-barrel domain
MRTSTLAASAAVLMLGTALATAQTTTPPAQNQRDTQTQVAPAPSQQPAPVIVTPAPTTPPGAAMQPPGTTAQPGTTATTTTTTTAQSGDMWYTAQGSEWRGSKLIGANVKNAAGENIGEINDVIIGQDGRLHAVVVGVGGFLGIGEREVAMSFNQLQLTRDSNDNPAVATTVTKETLEQAPRWTWRTTGTTGTTTGTTGTGTTR